MTGKEKCEFLKSIRINIANKNGISFTPKECIHEVDCMGSCPLCEYEAKILMEKLEEKLKNDGQIIIDTDSIEKLEQLNKEQMQKQNEEENIKVVDLYPKYNDKYLCEPWTTGDVSDNDVYLSAVPKPQSVWYEIREIVKLLSMFPKAIYKYITTKARCIKMNIK